MWSALYHQAGKNRKKSKTIMRDANQKKKKTNLHTYNSINTHKNFSRAFTFVFSKQKELKVCEGKKTPKFLTNIITKVK